MKKFLKVTGIIILLLVVIFFSLGLIFPQVSYTAEITVDKPVVEVFRKYNDIGTLSKWIPEMKSIEILEIKPGMVGTKMKMIIESEGQTMELMEEVIAFEENKLLGLTFDAGSMNKTDHVEFIGTGNRTTIKGTYICRGSNLFYKSLFSLFKSQFQTIDQTYLNNFKAFAEGKR